MHVLFTAHRFWPAVGGTEQVLMDLSRELLKLGHEVTVATSAEPGAPAEEDVRGIRVRRFELRRVGKFRLPPRDYAPFVVGTRADVVHVHGQRVWSSDHLFRHAKRIAKPKVFTAHGFHQWHMHRRDPLELWYYKRHLPRVLRHFDLSIALTEPERGELTAFGVDRRKVVVVPDGVDVEEFHARPAPGIRAKLGVTAKHMLLYAGGLYDNKDVPFLVRAVAAMRSDVELVVAGKDATGGKLRAEVESLARDLKAPVRVVGLLERAELVRAFFEADLFLLGSRFEGYGIVLLEAGAAGVPFVATPAGAAPDLAAKGGGLVASNPEVMARLADQLLADPERRRAMGEAGRRVAEAQTWASVARRHEEIYASLLRATP